MTDMNTHNGVDTTKLLHGLDAASNEQSSLTLDRVISKQILPGSSTKSFLRSGSADNVGVKECDVVPALLLASESLEHVHRLVVAVVCNQPPGRLVNDKAQDQHGNQEHKLQDARHSPGEALLEGGESVAHPVHQEDAKVQDGELHADVWHRVSDSSSRGSRGHLTKATARLGGVLGL